MQKWHRLDELLARYMTPSMVAAGFSSGRSRSYSAESGTGNLLLVAARGDTPIPKLTFEMHWGAIPRVLREYIASELGVRTPDVLAGICGGPVYVPDDINRYPGIRNGEWTLDPEREFEIFGRRLETFLRGEAIPLWLSMLEREAMAAEPGCGFCGEPGPLRQAVLYVDDADPALVQKWLDEAEHLDMPEAGEMVPWLRARLNNRIQTASG